jgi:hypothetical protein
METLGMCTSVESTPNIDVDSHLIRPLRDLWTTTGSRSHSMNMANLLPCLDTVHSHSQSGDCLRTPPPRMYSVPISPPRPRFNLLMRPLIGRSSNDATLERASWTLEVRAIPSRPSRRPLEASLFLPIQDSPSPNSTSFRQEEEEVPVYRQVSQQCALSTFDMGGSIASENEQEQQTKFQIYPAPSENVFFPQF